MATARSSHIPNTTDAQVDDIICHMGAADGYGGEAPGSELCRMPDDVPLPDHDSMAEIVDFHVDAHGGFWVCFDDVCREGSYEEALYVMGGRREVEG